MIKKYCQWLHDQIESGKITVTDIMNLKGKNLGCWCHPSPCHGDILKMIVDHF